MGIYNIYHISTIKVSLLSFPQFSQTLMHTLYNYTHILCIGSSPFTFPNLGVGEHQINVRPNTTVARSVGCASRFGRSMVFTITST